MKLVLKRIVIFSWVFFIATAVNIDDKLDFEDSNTRSSLRSYSTKHTGGIIPVKYTKTSTVTDNLDDIGIVCVSTGCNKTSSGNSDDSVQADVVVHVETKVNLNQSQNKTEDILEDTPDIPVVVGFSGSTLDSTVDDGNSGLVTPQSVFVPSNFGSVSNYQPGIVNNRRRPFTQPLGYRGSSSSFYGSNSYSPAIFSSTGSQRYPSGGNNIDNYSPSYHPESLTNSQGINRHFKVLSPVEVSIIDDTRNNMFNIMYRMNGTVPYFEPTYHSHYYGENPPPQYMWNHQNSNSFQGIDSKVDNPNWNSNSWHRTGPYQHKYTTVGGETKCICQNGQPDGRTTGLGWYPSVKRTFTNDPGSQINDKLAPLN